MKLILLILNITLSGCATTGMLLKGAGDGLSGASQKKNINCTTLIDPYSNQAYTNCN